MHHDTFGEIAYDKNELAWTGSCALPVFAEYHVLDIEAEPEFAGGLFPLRVQDETGDGPTAAQANAFRFLREREKEVCVAVMMEVLKASSGPVGDRLVAWLNRHRQSRFWGWLARLVGPEYKTAEDLKQAARCIGLEVSSLFTGTCAYVAFSFETIWGLEGDHGFSIIFHPEDGTWSGTASAIDEIL